MPIEKKRPVKVVAASNFYQLSSLKRHKAADNNEPPAASHKTQQQPSFNPLAAPYKTFKTQKQAYDFLDSQPCAELLRTFACEVSATGQRVFIVTSAELFWQQYKQLPASERHHYEIIRQSSPCNLYFDLEFCPATNPGVDGPALVQLLVCGTAEQLQQLWNIPWDDSYVLELDSSTQQKFSRHLIVRLPGIAFADVCHAGRFVRLVVLRLLQRGVHCWRHAQLLVHPKEGGGLTTFVDMGVYTRNRAFRLYLSSKYGKEACLRLTSRYGGARRCPKAAFHDLLVSVLHKRSSSSSSAALTPKPAAGRDQQQQQQQQRGWPRARRHFQAACGVSSRPVSLLRVEQEDWQQELQQLPAAWQQVPMLQLNPLPHYHQLLSLHQRQQQQQRHQGPAAAASSGVPWREMASAVVCHGSSPYPLLEGFITSVCVQGGVQGEIRSWMQLPGCVAFNIKNNRWCGNVERAHRSNGVYYVADLKAGVYFQKCWDPECRNYRSNCMPLPALVWQAYRRPAETTAGTASHGGAAAAAAAAGEAQALPVEQQPGFEQHYIVTPLPGPGSSWCSNNAGNEQQQQLVNVEEDELCVQLLQQFEERQQQLNELEAAAAGGQAVGQYSSKAACDASWAQQQDWAVHQHLQAHVEAQPGACGLNSSSHSGCLHSCCVGGSGGGGSGGVGGDTITQCGVVCDAGVDEDELCLQLLQDVEGC